MDDHCIFITYSELTDKLLRDAEEWAQKRLKSLG